MAAALLLAACGEQPPEVRQGQLPDRDGASAVAGTSLNEWAMLSVPRDGGSATVRSRTDLSDVIWESETSLPAAEEIRVVNGPLVILRTAAGEVFRFDPRTDELTPSGELADGARWSAWGAYGLFLDAGGSELLEIGPDGSWEYRLDASTAWASPVEEGRVAVLVEQADGTSVWLVRRGDGEPEARVAGSFSPPALVTAWGRRLAVLDGEADDLRFLTVPQLTSAGEIPLGAPATAMAASPSSHELYVSVDAPPRLVRISRFSGSVRTITEVRRTLREIRPVPLGQHLLAWDGSTVFRISLSGEEPLPLEGEWREDLPAGIPGGGILLVRDGRLHLWRPESGESAPVEAPADHWWVPVRWNPGPPTVVVGPVQGDPLPGERLFDSMRTADSEPSAAWPTAAGGADDGEDAEDRDGEVADDAPDDDPGGFPEPDAPDDPFGTSDDSPDDAPGTPDAVGEGFYAIVISARSPDGVTELAERLESAGYPTAVQRHEDDGGQIWFRGMVGPYPARTGAEAAARQLRRERSLQVWVTEVRSELSAEEIFD